MEAPGHVPSVPSPKSSTNNVTDSDSDCHCVSADHSSRVVSICWQ